MKTTTQQIIICLCLLLSCISLSAQTTEKDVTIIELVQTEGQFETQQLQLMAGKYQFRIVNKGVNHALGFLIQAAKDKDADVMTTALPNSFTTSPVNKGEAQYTGIVDLQKGTYVYVCPLNPTPHYQLIVN
jgi:hypothetical protein